MGVLKILFIAVLLTVSFGEIIRFEIIKGVFLNLSSLAVGILALYYILYHLIDRKIQKTELMPPLFIFIAICVLSLLSNFNSLKVLEMGHSSLYLVRFIFFLSLYFVIFDFDKKFRIKIPYFMVLIGAIVLLIAYIQYFFYPSLRNLYYLGWDEHLYRMFSSFLDPNFAGAFFSLYLFLVLGLFESELKRRRKIRTVILGGLAVFAFISVFLTYSRSAILMLMIGLMVFFVLKKRANIVLFLTLTILIGIMFAPKAFRTEGTNLFRKVSIEARISSAKEAVFLILRKPLLGVGFNAYKFAKNRYVGISLSNYPSHAESGTDASLLFILATTGVLGFFSYIWLLFKIISLAFLRYKKNLIAQTLFLSLVSLIINSFFINSLFYSFFMLWILILAGLTENG